eukprot:6331548-Amphidinium_carterae.1
MMQLILPLPILSRREASRHRLLLHKKKLRNTTSPTYHIATGANTLYKERADNTVAAEGWTTKTEHHTNRLRIPQQQQAQCYGAYYVR